jgi:hypothetical protein
MMDARLALQELRIVENGLKSRDGKEKVENLLLSNLREI